MPKPEGPQFTQYGAGMAVAPAPTEYPDEPKVAATPPPPNRPPNENFDTSKKTNKKIPSKKAQSDKYKDS